MSYNITWKNQAVDSGKTPITVPNAALDTTSTSLTLTGKGAANHGGIQQQNLLRLLESFADTTAPANPTVGQLWFDASVGTIKVLTDSAPPTWKSLGGITITNAGEPAPTPAALGDVWYQRTGTTSGFMYVYTGIGRFPLADTTIGGWDQVYPTVETFAGRDEYDELRSLLDRLIGPPVSGYGSGALGRAITNLTNFAALDQDLRTKYAALGPDTGVLVSSANDVGVTFQAPSTTAALFMDSVSPGSSRIRGITNGTPDYNVAGTILVNGTPLTLSANNIVSTAPVADGFIVYVTYNSTYLIFRRVGSEWEYDDGGGGWGSISADADYLIVGTITSTQTAGGTALPSGYGTVWAHAVPTIGFKDEHLKVAPISQDWDKLLAAAKYALDRLEVPNHFSSAISAYPFVHDGRQPPASLLAMPEDEPRYPAPGRRSGRKPGIISQVASYSSTMNAINIGIQNRFSLRGINASSGTHQSFGLSIVVAQHAGPFSNVLSSGSGDMTLSFNFASADAMARFIGSGGAIEVDVVHNNGSTANDAMLSTLTNSTGVWRITGDKTRFFGRSQPLTISRPSANLGLINATAAGVVVGSVPEEDAFLTMAVYRISSTRFDVHVYVSGGGGSGSLTGTTAITFNTIVDNEDSGSVYAAPIAFTGSHVTNAL